MLGIRYKPIFGLSIRGQLIGLVELHIRPRTYQQPSRLRYRPAGCLLTIAFSASLKFVRQNVQNSSRGTEIADPTSDCTESQESPTTSFIRNDTGQPDQPESTAARQLRSTRTTTDREAHADRSACLARGALFFLYPFPASSWTPARKTGSHSFPPYEPVGIDRSPVISSRSDGAAHISAPPTIGQERSFPRHEMQVAISTGPWRPDHDHPAPDRAVSFGSNADRVAGKTGPRRRSP